MTPDEIEQFDALPMEFAANQIAMEALSAMRQFNNRAGTITPEVRAIAEMTEQDKWAHLRTLADSTRLESDAHDLLACLNRFRASLAVFTDCCEAGIDQTGLIPVPDGLSLEQSSARLAIVEQVAAAKLEREGR